MGFAEYFLIWKWEKNKTGLPAKGNPLVISFMFPLSDRNRVKGSMLQNIGVSNCLIPSSPGVKCCNIILCL